MARTRSTKPSRRDELTPGARALAGAARAVAAVAFDGRSAEQALETVQSPDAERAAVRAIALGSVRWYLRLAPAIGSLLQRGADSVAPQVRALLVVAAHQIEYSRHAPELTANAAVDAARALGHSRATTLVNAVLRAFVARRGEILARTDAVRAARAAHPEWLLEAIDRDWAGHTDHIVAAGNAHPPMVLRVDLSRRSADEHVRVLADAGFAAQTLPWSATAIVLERPVAVGELPGFAEGVVSVQDAGAQLAAPLLAAEPGMRVLDACAAPGGKTGHLLEHTSGIELSALDIDAARLARVGDNLRRLRRDARLVAADVRDVDAFWDRRPYDRILLDAPCSSTGVIRRHPDIKLLRRASDIRSFAATQAQLLEAAFRMLAPGGRLLYATCSVLTAENEDVTERFLAREGSARAGSMPRAEALAPGAIQGRIGVQLLPGTQADTDGFHYACIEKATTGT